MEMLTLDMYLRDNVKNVRNFLEKAEFHRMKRRHFIKRRERADLFESI